MASEHPVLAFDTSAAHCAVALHLDGVIYAEFEEMQRGQAERLFPLIEDLLARHGVTFGDLGRVGVGIGPGNFTGLRISVSAARGLGLALDIPVIGVSTFEALRHAHDTAETVAVPAPRDMAYVQSGKAAPEQVARDAVPPAAVWPDDPNVLVRAIAGHAAHAEPPFTAPAPLYLRPADAAPSRDAPPVILDDA